MSNAEPIWRGVIERVEDGERVYIDHLDKMSIYFSNYLDQIGIKADNLGK